MPRAAAARRRPKSTPAPTGAIRASFPGFIAPCLATPGSRVPARGQWIHEIKHDGYRVQAHIHHGKATLFTRNGYDWTPRFRQIAQALPPLQRHDLVLDGEIVVMDERGVSDFHLLQDELAQKSPDRLTYLVFDLLYLDGWDFRTVPLGERKRALSQLFAEAFGKDSRIQFNPHIEADAQSLIEHACALHLEGIVSKEMNSVYRSGRQDEWIKIKCAKTDTFPIIAFVEKLGVSPRRIASLYLGRWEGDQLLYAGKAQTGFQQRMLYELRERLDPYIRKDSPLSVPIKKPKATWVEPAVLAEIEYSAMTAEKRLRAPVFKGIRGDLMAPRKGPKRTRAPKPLSSPGPKSNILQLLPDAVVPSREQLIRYWKAVGPTALTYLARRPLKLVRHERGATFYHKGSFPPIPKTVHQLVIEKREGGTGTRLWVDGVAGLLGLVEMGAVELHPWNSTIDDLEHPDAMVFDLDPGSGVGMSLVTETALALRDLLEQSGYSSWPKLTGGKGIHVMVPIEAGTLSHDETHRISRSLAERLAQTQPDRLTTSASLSARDGRLFIDYLRNGRGTTAVGTFSPRARRGFPIAAPITWEELSQGVRPDAYSMTRPWPKNASRAARALGKRTGQIETGQHGTAPYTRVTAARRSKAGRGNN
jgi:bifunctional non-homologous end joining protein LigD